MKKASILGLLALSWLGLAGPARAQENAPQLFFVYTEHVKPSMLMEYEALSKEWLGMMAEAEGMPDGLQFTTVMSPEFGYAYVSVVNSFSELDQLFQTWEAAVEAMGREKAMENMAKAGAAVDYAESYVLMLRPDLSYMPETTELMPEMQLRVYHWWYGLPGKEFELEAVAGEFAKLYKEKGVDRGFRVYQAVMGGDLPMYLVVEVADDLAEYHATTAEIQAKLGEAGAKLSQRAMKVARRIEMNHGWSRPDLSYPTVKPEGGRY